MEVTEPDGEISVGLSVSSLQEPPLEKTRDIDEESVSKLQLEQGHGHALCPLTPVDYGLLAVFVTLPFAEGLAKATGKRAKLSQLTTTVVCCRCRRWESLRREKHITNANWRHNEIPDT